MTREDIIRLAKEAGFSALTAEECVYGRGFVYTGSDDEICDQLQQFAALVEQHLVKQGYRKCAERQKTTQFCGMLEEAVEAEREACLKLATEPGRNKAGVAAAIRARGESK